VPTSHKRRRYRNTSSGFEIETHWQTNRRKQALNHFDSTQNYLGCGLRPSSRNVNTSIRKHNVSETGSVSVLRWGETPTLLNPIERANLIHWTILICNMPMEFAEKKECCRPCIILRRIAYFVIWCTDIRMLWTYIQVLDITLFRMLWVTNKTRNETLSLFTWGTFVLVGLC
jgi:hypothetical protein